MSQLSWFYRPEFVYIQASDKTTLPKPLGVACDAGMPGPMEGVVANVMLQLPIFRHLFAWIGAHPAGQQDRV
jgi:hypothetical protein